MTRSVLFVMGTRPEAIKLAPVILSLRNSGADGVRILSTGQHREMLDQTLEAFRLRADVDLDVMRQNQTLPELTARLMAQLDVAIAREAPLMLVVQGDTTTAMVAALAAFYMKIPVAHVEAGLRTDNVYSPFPEEMNRRLIGSIASLHFAPTDSARANLLREGIDDRSIYVTGNTAIDALLMTVRDTADVPLRIPTLFGGTLTDELIEGRRLVLVTAHRRESHDRGLASICDALHEIAILPNASIVFPVHLNPNVRSVVLRTLKDVPNIHITEPLGYQVFCMLMKKAFMILTDSGGIQEEAPSLGVPVLVMRSVTEREEGIHSGNAILTGTVAESIVSNVQQLWENRGKHGAMSSASNPYGDGNAAERIGAAINEFLSGEGQATQPSPKLNGVRVTQ